MKKLLLIAPVILVSQLALAANSTLYLQNPQNNNDLLLVHRGSGDGYFYKCASMASNAASTYSCKQAGYILIDFLSKSGGGTSDNPYILTSCSFVSCACSHLEYLSDTTCISCPYNLMALSYEGTHTNSGLSACQHCPQHMLKQARTPFGEYQCVDCPSYAICYGSEEIRCVKGYYKKSGTVSCSRCPSDSHFMYQGTATYGTTSSSGKTAITDCFIPSGTYDDDTGTFKITSNCPYK